MRHATSDALDRIEPMLEALRGLPGVVERSRGVFYRRSTAFLHFHEDPSGMHADLRVDEDFVRFRVETAEERGAFLTRVRSALASG